MAGLGVLITALTGRPEDQITAGNTTTVLMVVASLSPHDARRQPILRLAGTAIGVAAGVVAASLGPRAVRPWSGRRRRHNADRPPAVATTAQIRRYPQQTTGPDVIRGLIMTTAHDEAPKILDLPIGLDATGIRKEFGSPGAQQHCAG